MGAPILDDGLLEARGDIEAAHGDLGQLDPYGGVEPADVAVLRDALGLNGGLQVGHGLAHRDGAPRDGLDLDLRTRCLVQRGSVAP